MTVYCWHQTALLLVAFATVTVGRPSGLLDPPTGSWLGHRLLWLPAFALALATLCTLFHRFERPSNAGPGGRFTLTRRPGNPASAG